MGIEERIRDVISAFDAQGWHRTGTTVDSDSARWLADDLAATGALAAIETYRFERRVPRDAFIELCGGTDERFDGVPLFDSPSTPPEGVTARIGASAGQIALLPVAGVGGMREVNAARRSSLAGVVTASSAARPGVAPINAESFRYPFGCPALQLPGEALAPLRAAADNGDPIRLVSTFDLEPTFASNVTGIVAGADPSLPPLCVMTPRSGWWSCASERGGGIACLLEIARAVAAERPRRTVRFAATTGHELGHWGLEELLLRRPGLAQGAALWIHLGASIGAALDPRTSIYASRRDLEADAQRFLEASGTTLPRSAPEGVIGGGESRNIHEAGGAYVSLAGGSAVFHLEEDRWPEAVDVAQVAAIARGMSAFALQAANA